MGSRDTVAQLKVALDASTKTLTDLINSNRDELLAKLESDKVDIIAKLQSELTAVRNTVTRQDKEILELKNKVNSLDQQSRSSSIRIFGLNITKEAEDTIGKNKAVMKLAYDRVIKPILDIALEKRTISSVPAINNLIADGFKLQSTKTGNASAPPACLITFISKEMRDVVLRLKKDNTPPPSAIERAAGIKRIILVEDLTAATHRKLKELVDHEAFAKVWTINGIIRFTLANDQENVVRKVPSPFLSVQQILDSNKRS
jgi:hypothetical protein